MDVLGGGGGPPDAVSKRAAPFVLRGDVAAFLGTAILHTFTREDHYRRIVALGNSASQTRQYPLFFFFSGLLLVALSCHALCLFHVLALSSPYQKNVTGRSTLDSGRHRGSLGLLVPPGLPGLQANVVGMGRGGGPAARGSISARAGSDKCTGLFVLISFSSSLFSFSDQGNGKSVCAEVANLQHQANPRRVCLAGGLSGQRMLQEESDLYHFLLVPSFVFSSSLAFSEVKCDARI